jgi:hypothetical protein
MKSLPEMQPGIKLASRVQQAQCSLQTVPPSERLQNINGVTRRFMNNKENLNHISSRLNTLLSSKEMMANDI